MPRAKPVSPNVLLKAWITPELLTRLQLHLFSQVEGKIPHGKISEFVSDRLREFFGWKQLDLSPYGLPGGYFVKAPAAMIDELKRKLEAVA